MQHWMGPVLQPPADSVTVLAGAVTVTVLVTAGVVVGEPQRFSAGAGVATARTATEARTATVEIRENMFVRCRGELESLEVVLMLETAEVHGRYG